MPCLQNNSRPRAPCAKYPTQSLIAAILMTALFGGHAVDASSGLKVTKVTHIKVRGRVA